MTFAWLGSCVVNEVVPVEGLEARMGVKANPASAQLSLLASEPKGKLVGEDTPPEEELADGKLANKSAKTDPKSRAIITNRETVIRRAERFNVARPPHGFG